MGAIKSTLAARKRARRRREDQYYGRERASEEEAPYVDPTEAALQESRERILAERARTRGMSAGERRRYHLRKFRDDMEYAARGALPGMRGWAPGPGTVDATVDSPRPGRGQRRRSPGEAGAYGGGVRVERRRGAERAGPGGGQDAAGAALLRGVADRMLAAGLADTGVEPRYAPSEAERRWQTYCLFERGDDLKALEGRFARQQRGGRGSGDVWDKLRAWDAAGGGTAGGGTVGGAGGGDQRGGPKRPDPLPQDYAIPARMVYDWQNESSYDNEVSRCFRGAPMSDADHIDSAYSSGYGRLAPGAVGPPIWGPGDPEAGVVVGAPGWSYKPHFEYPRAARPDAQTLQYGFMVKMEGQGGQITDCTPGGSKYGRSPPPSPPFSTPPASPTPSVSPRNEREARDVLDNFYRVQALRGECKGVELRPARPGDYSAVPMWVRAQNQLSGGRRLRGVGRGPTATDLAMGAEGRWEASRTLPPPPPRW